MGFDGADGCAAFAAFPVCLPVAAGQPGIPADPQAFLVGGVLWISGSLGGIGLNPVTAAAVLSLGLPGYAALTVLRLL